jgi:hypothetical protein
MGQNIFKRMDCKNKILILLTTPIDNKQTPKVCDVYYIRSINMSYAAQSVNNST